MKDGDWGLGIGPNPQSPIPNPQLQLIIYFLMNNKEIIYFYKLLFIIRIILL